jgi:cytochrome P450
VAANAISVLVPLMSTRREPPLGLGRPPHGGRSTLGGVHIRAGTTISIFPHAANRDPTRFEDPNALRLDRPNARENLAFGRGIHTCPGGPLARVEARIAIERILDRALDIGISEAAHGVAGDRRYEYDPTYVLRGVRELHVEFTPAEDGT